jgi:hypothetical protein
LPSYVAYIESAIEARLGFTSEDFAQHIAKIFMHRNYGKTGAETMAREVDLHPVHEVDPRKLARQADFPPAGDNGLVPDKEECSDESRAI